MRLTHKVAEMAPKKVRKIDRHMDGTSLRLGRTT
jgi:hypothetical protein